MDKNAIQTRAENIFLKQNSRPNANLADPLSSRPGTVDQLEKENDKLSKRLGMTRAGRNPQAAGLEASGYLTAAQVCNITGQSDEFRMRKTLENIPHRLDDDGKCVYHRSDVGKFLKDAAHGRNTRRFL